MYYFISDVHLGFYKREKDKPREELFLKLLDKLSINSEKIYLVGDIFDFWFDYNTVIPKDFYRILTKLSELKSKGIDIVYLMGNHDFGHNKFFKEELGIEVIQTDIEITLQNKKIYIAHGDGKAYNDTGYLILKKILRSNWANKIFRFLHPDFGIWLASNSSKSSRSYTDKKDFSEKDGLKDFAITKIEEGFDYVIMGHKHKKNFLKHEYEKSGKLRYGYYVNLGEWFNDPQIGIFGNGELKLSSVKEFVIE